MSFFDYPTGTADTSSSSATFLADASDEEWATIRAHSELVHTCPGETLISEGDADRALYIVVDGALEATVAVGRRGRERRISTIEAGTVIGEVGFFDGGRRSAVVRAVSDARLLRLGHESFQVLAAKDPALGQAILFDLGRVLATRLREVEALSRPNG